MERLTDSNANITCFKNREPSGYAEIIDVLARRLAAYEDTGLTPEEIKSLQTSLLPDRIEKMLRWEEADKDGRLPTMPFVAMIEQSLQDGKMTPQRDQRFNGRYGVVYMDKSKWGTPLIDICGTPYNTEQAEARAVELAHKDYPCRGHGCKDFCSAGERKEKQHEERSL